MKDKRIVGGRLGPVRHWLANKLVKPSKAPADVDMETAFHEIWDVVRPYTLTSKESGYALFKAVEYVTTQQIPGALVECGIYRGGSSMLMALAALHFGGRSRPLHMFDTFAGMTRPGVFDHSTITGNPVLAKWESGKRSDNSNEWDFASLAEVKQNFRLTNYPPNLLYTHVGDVASTLPGSDVSSIAILRLDTDLYESTKVELEQLYPKVSELGFVIVDDYGHYAGARRATDEYLETRTPRPFLQRVNYTVRMLQVTG
jgi:O-methyltransferase